MAKIFISYSKQDEKIVRELAFHLEALGHEILVDYKLLRVSQPMVDILSEALKTADVFLAFLSEFSLSSSYVNSEIGQAVAYGKMIIPVAYGKTEVPTIIGNLVYITIDDNRVREVSLAINESIKGKFGSVVLHTSEIIELVEAGGIGYYDDWLNDLRSSYSSYQELKPNVIDAFFKATWRELAEDNQKRILEFMRLVWCQKNFGSVGIARVGIRSLHERAEFFFETTAKLLSGIQSKMPLSALLESVSVYIDDRGELRACKLRAIAILSDLEIPSIFSQWRYEHLMVYLGLEYKPFPNGLLDIKNAVVPLLPEIYRNDKMVLYIFPWVIFAELVDNNVSDPKPPEELPEEADSDDTDFNNSGGNMESPVSETKGGPSYWLISCNKANWNFTDTVNVQHFHTHEGNGAQRVNYESFLAVKPGDMILAYTFPKPNTISAIFKVTNRVNDDTKRGPLINFIIQKGFDFPISWLLAEGVVSKDLIAAKQDPWRLLPITAQDYNAILALERKRPVLTSTQFRPYYKTEGRHQQTEDKLEFENDINSFASVIALKTVTPPLAIGLFGMWGSGKSFFMEKLREEIKTNANSGNDIYVNDIVHVEFNSWHYSDSNLWASLITEIFESLNKHAIKRNCGADAVNAIYKQLQITTLQIEETQKKLDENKVRVAQLGTEKEDLEKEIKAKQAKLGMWDAGKIVEIVLEDPQIKKRLSNLQDEYANENLTNSIDDINSKIKEVESFIGKTRKAYQLFKESSKGHWWLLWTIVILVVVGLALLESEDIRHFIQTSIGKIAGAIVAILAIVGPYYTQMKPYLEKAGQYYDKLKSFKDTIEKKMEDAKFAETEQREKLEKEIANLTVKESQLATDLANKECEKQSLEKQLTEIGSGKMLANFIAGRSSDENYAKQLGIISWIRKDFVQLSFLFEQQAKARQEAKDPKYLDDAFHIDRIVLYIDDLDRCHEDIVVKVLEAIHLLLALPLFVVIVGVDPRWLNNALDRKYKHLFGTSENENDKNNAELSGIATSYDYLEKIFQIPFALKPINETGRKELIKYLIKDEMEIIPGVAKNVVGNVGPKQQQGDTSVSSNIGDTGAQNIGGNEQSAYGLQVQEDKVRKDLGNTNDGNTKEDKPQKITANLNFSKGELEFMQKISVIFGHTPRTINRYVNIYRIIKAHQGFQVSETFSEDDYIPTMTVLSIVVGYSELAQEFIAELTNADDGIKYSDFLAKTKLKKELVDVIKDNTGPVILSLTMDSFKRNIDLISRFSFRTLKIEANNSSQK